jgi:cytoskeletal protein RodZ
MPSWLTRSWGLILAILICCTPEMLSAASGQRGAPAQTEAPSAQSSGSTSQATVPAQTQSATDANAGAANSSASAQPLPDAPSTTAQANANQTPANNAQDQQAEPAGTAAAQIGKLKGGPASKPAGAAIAPAKQRRVRSLLIKLGVLAGAGVAVGTVYALSQGSPSRPPGAH